MAQVVLRESQPVASQLGRQSVVKLGTLAVKDQENKKEGFALTKTILGRSVFHN